MSVPATLALEAAYRALDPQEGLDPSASEYTRRPAAPLATLATQLRLDRRAGLHLVSGHIGSGKTTELRRLEAELESTARVRFVSLDLLSQEGRLSAAEIAGTLAVAVVAITEGLSFWDAAHSTNARQHIDEILGSTATMALEALGLEPEAWGFKVRRRDDRDTKQIIDATRKILESDYNPAPPVVLLDGLDKLSLNEIESTLSQVLAWQLPLSLVATVPLSYLFTPSFSRREGSLAGVHVVPALPVIGRNFQPNPSTLEWFESVLVSRSVRNLFDDDAVELLALETAGIIRDFIRSCREAILAALVQSASRVDVAMAKIALDEFALRMSRPVGGDDLRVLNVVGTTGRVVGHSTFLALIDGGQIVEYRNGSNWYAVHPLLRDIVAQFAEELAS